MTDLDSPKKNNDCYFYYYSTCAKGDSCTFRHEPSALGCETMCSFWKEGKCVNVHCNFRHMELRKNRKAIPCYWESQPIGCLKAHCPFLHQNPRPGEAVNRSNLTTGESVGDLNNSERKVTAVDGLVVNFEEESDSESMATFSPTYTPYDHIDTVKSLEEIRLEKVQAESAAYYSFSGDGYDDQANVLRQRIYSRMVNKSPERIVTHKRHSDSSFIPVFEKKRKIVLQKEDGNLEIILNKRRDQGSIKDRITFPDHRMFRRTIENDVCNRRVNHATVENSVDDRRENYVRSLHVVNQTNLEDIKIKTLEEIRRERKAKEEMMSTSNDDEQEVTSTCMDVDVKSTEKNILSNNRDKKIVLKRQLPISNKSNEVVLSDINNSYVPSDTSRLSESKISQDQCETESTCSKLDERLLLEDDDMDEDTVMLKPEDELLNEVDDFVE